jgi:ribosomal-protein-alanine N-acetyltransferase
VNIRRATVNDIPAILRIAAQSSSAAQWSKKQYEDLLSSDQESRHLLILAVNGDDPLGFLVAHHVAPDWELENIVVAESARRRGIGTRLLEELLISARKTNSDSVFLEVRESNAIARALYEQLGFQHDGRRKSYYSNPVEDALLYHRTLR